MGKNSLVRLPAIFQRDLAGKMERLQDKLIAAEATVASLESERGILAGEVHSGEQDRKELDRVNERHERATRLVAEIKAAIAAVQSEIETKTEADGRQAAADRTALLTELGDKRHALIADIETHVQGIVAAMKEAQDIGAEIVRLAPRLPMDEVAASALVGRVSARLAAVWLQTNGADTDAKAHSRLPLPAQYATGAQIAEMASRPAPPSPSRPQFIVHG